MTDHEHCPVCEYPICRLLPNRRYKCPNCDQRIMRFGHQYGPVLCAHHGQFAEWDACISLIEYARVVDNVRTQPNPPTCFVCGEELISDDKPITLTTGGALCGPTFKCPNGCSFA
jgi:hypothetical protein